VKRITLFSALILSVTGWSCKRTDHVVCTGTDLRVIATGFSSGDFDSAIVVRYKKDNAFDVAIDTIAVNFYPSGTNTTFTVALEDTDAIGRTAIDSGVENGYPNGFLPGYDYKLFLPSIGKSYAIANITQSGITSNDETYTASIVAHEPRKCFDNVVSCTVNGTPYSFASNIYIPESVLDMPR
jgi:hypothetical protein